MTDIKKWIGEAIATKRKAIGASQQDLAAYLKYSRTSIVNIESGRQGLPVNELWMACCFLGCTPNDLFPPVENVEFTYEEYPVTIYERVPKIIMRRKKVFNAVPK